MQASEFGWPDDEPRATSAVATLQDAVLPTDVPLLPGLSVAARYLLAADPGRAGGDWFDVVTRPDDRAVLVAGDVPGGGVPAAAVMSRLATVLRERLCSGASLVEAMTAVDAFARHEPDAGAATVALVEIAPRSGEVRYVLAGHPPPLVVSDGHGRFLTPLGGRPLATGGTYAEGREQLERGELLMVYTDGLVERRDRDHTFGPVELTEVAVAACARSRMAAPPRGAAERACAMVLDDLVGRSAHRDDATLLVAHRVDEPTELRGRIDADDAEVTGLRTSLAEWLGRLGARLVDRVALLQAFDEGADNVLRHAYDGSRGPLALHGRLTGAGVLELEISDEGRWHPELPPGDLGAEATGRGLMVVGSLIDGLVVEPSETGTRLRLRHRLGRQVELLEAVDELPLEQAQPVLRIRSRGTHVSVEGPVEAEGATDLRGALLRAGLAGCRSIDVDLTGATRLDGRAIGVLFEALARAGEHGTTLSITALPGSPAQHLLETASLPYSGGAASDPRLA